MAGRDIYLSVGIAGEAYEHLLTFRNILVARNERPSADIEHIGGSLIQNGLRRWLRDRSFMAGREGCCDSVSAFFFIALTSFPGVTE